MAGLAGRTGPTAARPAGQGGSPPGPVPAPTQSRASEDSPVGENLARQRAAQENRVLLTEAGAAGASGHCVLQPVVMQDLDKELNTVIILSQDSTDSHVTDLELILNPAQPQAARSTVNGAAGAPGHLPRRPAAARRSRLDFGPAPPPSLSLAVTPVKSQTSTLKTSPLNHALLMVAGRPGLRGLPAACPAVMVAQ